MYINFDMMEFDKIFLMFLCYFSQVVEHQTQQALMSETQSDHDTDSEVDIN